MATQCNSLKERRFFVRLSIGVSAQFQTLTKKEVTFDNLRDFFTYLGPEEMAHVLFFLDEAEKMGCKLIGYSNPLSSHSIIYAEFQLEVPEDKVDEFKSRYARYFYMY